MSLNKPSRDTSYDQITINSTDIEKIDTILSILRNSTNPIIPDYYKLHIQPNQERLFDAKLFATGFVQNGEPGLHQSISLTNEGILALDKYGSYANFINQTKME